MELISVHKLRISFGLDCEREQSQTYARFQSGENSVEFEWDEEKRLAVAEKHGVDMLYAARIFRGPVLTKVDNRRDYGETRHLSLGVVDGQVFVVVHTERDGVVRLISAWKGGRHEQRQYEASLAGRD